MRLKQHKKSNVTRKKVNTAVEATAMISCIKISYFFAGDRTTLGLGATTLGFLLTGAEFDSSGGECEEG